VSPNREKTKRLQQLTRAQRAVYRELLTGKNYREIAKIIGISKNTVGQHIQRIYKTFGVNSTTELLVGSQDY
jgi:DNA-binding CsgD family transcriptional regulator